MYGWVLTKANIILEIVLRWLTPFLGSSLAHLEPELELLEVDDIGNDAKDDLSHSHIPSFKQL